VVRAGIPAGVLTQACNAVATMRRAKSLSGGRNNRGIATGAVPNRGNRAIGSFRTDRPFPPACRDRRSNVRAIAGSRNWNG
jgi:hypothetical protein